MLDEHRARAVCDVCGVEVKVAVVEKNRRCWVQLPPHWWQLPADGSNETDAVLACSVACVMRAWPRIEHGAREPK